jgi:hypothetical protein
MGAAYLRGPHAAMADEVMEVVRGVTVAQKLIFDVRSGHAAPDALLEAVRAAGDGHGLRGLCRELQKALERTRPAP